MALYAACYDREPPCGIYTNLTAAIAVDADFVIKVLLDLPWQQYPVVWERGQSVAQ
jgi:hypothetical protein